MSRICPSRSERAAPLERPDPDHCCLLVLAVTPSAPLDAVRHGRRCRLVAGSSDPAVPQPDRAVAAAPGPSLLPEVEGCSKPEDRGARASPASFTKDQCCFARTHRTLRLEAATRVGPGCSCIACPSVHLSPFSRVSEMTCSAEVKRLKMKPPPTQTTQITVEFTKTHEQDGEI